MKSYYILSAIGKDRPGIVADVSEVIYECGGNIEDSNMGLLRTHFALLILFSAEKEEIDQKLSVRLKRLEWEKRLTVFFRPLEGEPVPYAVTQHAAPYELQAVGVDKAGIVARLARCLASHNINITQMSTSSRPEPGTGTPIYHMRVRMEVPGDVDPNVLRTELDGIAESLHIDLSFQPPKD